MLERKAAAMESNEYKRASRGEYMECITTGYVFGCGGGMVFLLVFLVIVLPVYSIVTIDPTQVAIVYNTPAASLSREVLQQGMQTIPPFGDVIRWPAVYSQIEFSGKNQVACNTKDGLLLALDVSLQFVPRQSSLYDLTLRFGDFEAYARVVRAQALGAVQTVCCDFTADQVQTMRAEMTEKMGDEVMALLLERLSTDMSRFQLRNVERPKDYESVVRRKENARSDIRLAENEREQALTQAKTKLQINEQEAQKILNTATTTVRLVQSQAIREAEGLRNRFDTLATIYKQVKLEYGLSTRGTMNYISNQLFSQGSSDIAVDLPSSLDFTLP